jgi:four helix bundle protein
MSTRKGASLAGAPFEKLRVWHSAMDLAEAVYRVTAALPRHEDYELKRQLRRAAISIPANIAEGQARFGARQLLPFLDIAIGSLREVETLLEVCRRVGYLDGSALERIAPLRVKVASELTRLMDALRQRIRRPE